jgi:putative ubiquitin-RnfH superfamily antitoxin RatB of RatAB toxin-antitoxin module
MPPDTAFDIEVVYALPAEQIVIALKVAPGTTVAEAVKRSGLPARFREIDALRVAVGIYGRRVARDTVLAPGDRIEIYRVLTADPKQARRRRAACRP